MSHFYEQSLKLNSERKASEREWLRERVLKLRAEGLPYAIIGQRFGFSENKARVIASGRAWREPRP